MRDVFWPLAGTMLLQTVSSLIFLTAPVLGPELAAAAGFDGSRIGIYSALVFAGAMPVSLICGGLIARYGALRVMQVGMLVSCVALLGALPALTWLLFVSAVLVGMGYGPNTPGASHVLARVTAPRDRPLVFSIKQSGAPLGGFLAGLLLPAVVALAGWRVALLVTVLLGIAAVFAVQPLRARADDDRRPDRRLSVRGSWAQLRLLATSADMRRLTLASFTYASVQICLFSFLVTYLVDAGGMTLVAAGAVFSAMQLSGVVARILWGWVADRLVPARWVLAGLGLASALCMAGIGWAGSGWSYGAVVLLAAAAGATVSGWNGVFLAEVARAAPPGQVSTATGGTVFFTYFGLVVGPAVFSLVVALSDYVVAFHTFAAAALLAAMLLFPGFRQGPNRPDAGLAQPPENG